MPRVSRFVSSSVNIVVGYLPVSMQQIFAGHYYYSVILPPVDAC